MLVTSKIDESKWVWINIPKTASTLIRNSIFKYEHPEDRQDHYTYLENIQMYGEHTGFTVVRNPINRFISGLNHWFNHCYCGKCTLFLHRPPNTIEVTQFLTDIVNLSKSINNFHYKTYYNGSDTLWLEIIKSLQTNFIQSKIIHDPVNCIMWSFILPQYLYLDGMNIRDYIFKYEEINTCINFIETKLGYVVDTSARPRSFPYSLQNVDFDDNAIKTLLYEYYQEDYKQLNY